MKPASSKAVLAAARPRDPLRRVYLWAAPIVGEKLPTRNEFNRVPCVRITGESVVFRWPTEFPYPRVILAIGTTTEASYLQARVLKTTPDESRQYSVHCEFVERYAAKRK